MPLQDRIQEKLSSIFAPLRLEIVDESSLHVGHIGARPEGETHFHVTMSSEEFRGLSKLAMHRRVYAALDEELLDRIHALRLDLSVPDASDQVGSG